VQCALILLSPVEPLFVHAGFVYVDPALAAAAKAKEALINQHIHSDTDSEADDHAISRRKNCHHLAVNSLSFSLSLSLSFSLSLSLSIYLSLFLSLSLSLSVELYWRRSLHCRTRRTSS
jgi:hypothetical protein